MGGERRRRDFHLPEDGRHDHAIVVASDIDSSRAEVNHGRVKREDFSGIFEVAKQQHLVVREFRVASCLYRFSNPQVFRQSEVIFADSKDGIVQNFLEGFVGGDLVERVCVVRVGWLGRASRRQQAEYDDVLFMWSAGHS